MRDEGRDMTHFGFGESPFSVHPKLCDAFAGSVRHKSYLPGLGLPQLRENIAAYYQKHADYDFSAARIAVGPGSKELIYHLLYVLEGPVILPAPSWVSYAPQAILHGRAIHFVRTKRQDGYRMSAAALAAALAGIHAPQKILIINSPGNPTGQVYNREELKALAAVCCKHNVIVISDEIYAQTDFTAPMSPGLAAYCPQQVLITAGLSKAYGAGGWRLGFAAAAHDSLLPVFNALAVVISETFSCVCAPLQYAACLAYSDDEEIKSHIRACATAHAAVVFHTARRLRECGLYCADGQGGFYLFPNFDDFGEKLRARGIMTAADLASVLLDECAIAALPADDFGLPTQELALRFAPMDYDGDGLLHAIAKSGGDPAAVIPAHAATFIPRVVAGCERLKQWLDKI